jgi:hypothetical protein
VDQALSRTGGALGKGELSGLPPGGYLHFVPHENAPLDPPAGLGC